METGVMSSGAGEGGGLVNEQVQIQRTPAAVPQRSSTAETSGFPLSEQSRALSAVLIRRQQDVRKILVESGTYIGGPSAKIKQRRRSERRYSWRRATTRQRCAAGVAQRAPGALAVALLRGSMAGTDERPAPRQRSERRLTTPLRPATSHDVRDLKDVLGLLQALERFLVLAGLVLGLALGAQLLDLLELCRAELRVLGQRRVDRGHILRAVIGESGRGQCQQQCPGNCNVFHRLPPLVGREDASHHTYQAARLARFTMS